MIPQTLQECFQELDRMLTPMDKALLRRHPDPFTLALEQHHGLGQDIRNEWGLWDQGSALHAHLRDEHRIEHPDDMSDYILGQYFRAHLPTVWDRLLQEE